MEIQLSQIAKRFRYEWIFKGIDIRIKSGENYAILGSNGSGKSTLMKIICGHLSPSQGEINYLLEEKAIERDRIYNYVSYAAPYIGLIEEFTLTEMIRFHFQFNERFAALTDKELMERLSFSKSAKHQAIQFFSSGMKQRLKLLLACCSTNPILLLDEPTTNLDKQGFQWYHSLIEEFAKEKTVIVASNEERDYSFCNHQINIQNFKPA